MDSKRRGPNPECGEIGGGKATPPGAMNPLSWNYRGLGNPRPVRALQDIVRWWNPKVVLLMETKAKNRRMERIKYIIGLANGLFVPCVSRKGGLAMLWARDIDLEIKRYSLNHIDAIINNTKNDYKWRLTGFYGHPETHRRYES